MASFKTTLQFISFVFIILLSNMDTSSAQVDVINGIEYKQISNFESNYSIIAMKISADGSKIVFATGGPAVKVYTIDADGTDLAEIYDFERTGTGPMVDISASGDKVVWCDGVGEVYIANSDGTNRVELATLLPHPNPIFEDVEPWIPLPPRITADGSQVFFIHMGHDPLGAGVYRINADNSGLTLLFNYNDMAADLFALDSSEYNRNTAFADGFDISADGSRMIFGTKIFKIAAGDIVRGDAIVVDGTTFYNVGEYASGYQPFSTYEDGDRFVMFKLEYNPAIEYDEINVYFVPLGTGDPVKVISGLDVFGISAFTQMASSGTLAIVHGANGRLPITRVDRISGSQLDLVSIDNLSIAMGGYRFSDSWLPSITASGDLFCFLSTGTPPQIWLASINSDAINSDPAITQIQFNPDHVGITGTFPSTITAHVNYPGHEIHVVTFDGYQDGVFKFRALEAEWPYSGILVDDGTTGDESAGDGFYTNNTVRTYLPETPLGTYTVRIAAADADKRAVSAADATPFYIVESTVSIDDRTGTPGFSIQQNYPNPFRSVSNIRYEIPVDIQVEIKVYDILGKEVAMLVNEVKGPGKYSFDFQAEDLPGGIYFYSMRAGDYFQVRKMQVLK